MLESPGLLMREVYAWKGTVKELKFGYGHGS